MPQDIEATRTAVAAGDGMVRALLTERTGLVQRGNGDRVSQVDEQLRLRGYPTDGLPGATEKSAAERRAASQDPDGEPQGRGRRRTATAD